MPRPGFAIDLSRMFGGGPPEAAVARTPEQIVADGKREIEQKERAMKRESLRLTYMREVQSLLESDENVRRYAELIQLICSPDCGQAEPPPQHDLHDDCGDKDCPVHGEANRVRA